MDGRLLTPTAREDHPGKGEGHLGVDTRLASMLTAMVDLKVSTVWKGLPNLLAAMLTTRMEQEGCLKKS